MWTQKVVEIGKIKFKSYERGLKMQRIFLAVSTCEFKHAVYVKYIVFIPSNIV